jgi:hypothetical protein
MVEDLRVRGGGKVWNSIENQPTTACSLPWPPRPCTLSRWPLADLPRGALVLVAAVTAAAEAAGSNRTPDIGVPAPSLGGKSRAAVVLPPGYATSGKRDPVVRRA